MKNIVVKAFPSVKAIKGVIDSIPVAPENTSLKPKLKDDLLFISEDNNGDTRVNRLHVVYANNGVKYGAVAPHLIHVFLNNAINSLNLSEHIKDTSFINCVDMRCEDVLILLNEPDLTHKCYDEFIENKLNGVVMLATAIEAFSNFLLTKKNQSAKFNTKIDTHIVNLINDVNYWNTNKAIRSSIKEIYRLRNKIIHLEYSNETLDGYSNIIKEIIKIDLESSITNVITYFNDIHNKIGKGDFVNYNE